MRRNKKVILLAGVSAFVLAATACGAKDKTGDQPSESPTQAVSSTTDSSKADTTVPTTDTMASSADPSKEESGEAATTAETTNPPVGDLNSQGVYQSESGKYEITPPKGWNMDDSSDKSYITYVAPNGDDTVEVADVSGSDIDSEREAFPNTAEEYQKMVSRGDGMQILTYDVKTKDDGSQTFHYSAKYDKPDDGVHFRAVSGVYDASKKTYVCATGNVMSTDENEIKLVEDSVQSLKTK